MTTVLSFDLRRVFAAPDRTQLVRVDPATCVLHAYSALTCLSLFWERTGLLYLYLEGLSLFGGPYEYEGFCMWRAYPSPPLSATRMRISASCLYIARCYFGNQLVLQSSDLEGSYNTDPGHGYSGSWFVFSIVLPLQ